jgi:signal transduction histidine kinase
MKLQLKLALYNTLTKIAVILFTGTITLLAIEKISVNHIEVRLEKSKDQLFKNLSSNEINSFLVKDKIYSDYNILNQEFVQIKPIAYTPNVNTVIKYRTADRIVDNTRETYRILSTRFNFNNHTYLLEIGESIESIEDLKTIIKQFTIVVLIVALALTLASDLIFTKYLLNPFYKIIDRKLIKVNDPLNFDYEKVKTTTQDFNLLDDSISLLMKKISDLFLLEKQFIANVSHELLTPISIISTRLENVMLQEANLSEDAENKLFASLKTLNRLKAIINSLLLISKVENNQFNKGDQVMIAGVINEIAEELEDRLEDKKIQFNNRMIYHYDMTANRPLIHTLLFNIINNAIKYNVNKGHIVISDDLVNNTYSVKIADTGLGMDTAEIDKAFNRFEKLESDEMESFGLGLAIVKSIAAFHSIKIDIRSNKGKGTTFELTFLNR